MVPDLKDVQSNGTTDIENYNPEGLHRKISFLLSHLYI